MWLSPVPLRQQLPSARCVPGKPCAYCLQTVAFPFRSAGTAPYSAKAPGILCLEEMENAKERGAAILAELVGFGMTSDAADMVNPNIHGPTAAMQIALDDAGLSPGDIDYLNAHGTATTANDLNETRAIKKVLERMRTVFPSRRQSRCTATASAPAAL